MKNNNTLKYILIAIAVAALLYLLLHKSSFSWTPTFKSNDTEPYGCMLFDSVMSASMPGRYAVSDSLPEAVMREKENRNKTVLCLYSYADIDPQQVINFAKKGGNVIIATHWMNDELAISFSSLFTMFDYIMLNKNGLTPVEGEYSTVRFLKSNQFKERKYKLSKVLVSTYITPYDIRENLFQGILESDKKNHMHALTWQDVITTGDKFTLMKSAKCGKGSISLISMPLLFTNYGILEDSNHQLIMRIFSSVGNSQIIRTSALRSEDYEDKPIFNNQYQSDYDESLLNEAFKSNALRTALYLAIAGLVLFIIFNSRRQQRIIPVIKRKENGQLEFIKQIGGFFKRNNATENIINKKYTMFTAKLQKILHIDISDKDKTNENIKIIAQYTRIPQKEVQDIIYSLDFYFNSRKSEEKRIYEQLKSRQKYAWMNEHYMEMEVKKRKSKTSKEEMIRLVNSINRIEQKL